ncbi:hypothetical protein LJK87_04790 [Paenibacillus sp. P25]|nr:hypothetical protein LJK87_04790 [Paenibacillus sp. P25]
MIQGKKIAVRKNPLNRRLLAVQQHRDDHGQQNHDRHLNDQIDKRIFYRSEERLIAKQPFVVVDPIEVQIGSGPGLKGEQ